MSDYLYIAEKVDRDKFSPTARLIVSRADLGERMGPLGREDLVSIVERAVGE
ncbi:MAG: hypothetical protein ABFD89_16650 [Bryobacteraceae bacterium]